MKNILTTFLIILSVNVFAQKGFYIRPVIGAGISKLTFRKISGFSLDRTSCFGYKGGINIGYRFKRLGIETGLNYNSIAYELKNLVFESNAQPFTGNAILSVYDARARFNYITLPISVNYQVPLINKFNLLPQIGFGLNYNLNGKATFTPKSPTDPKMVNDLPRNVTTCSGIASILIQYNLSHNLSVAAGPAVNYIYSDIDHIFQHSYSNLLLLTFDAGVTIKL